MNILFCGKLVVRQAVRERQVCSKSAIQRQIPEYFSRMTDYYHESDIRRKLLYGGKVLKRSFPELVLNGDFRPISVSRKRLRNGDFVLKPVIPGSDSGR